MVFDILFRTWKLEKKLKTSIIIVVIIIIIKDITVSCCNVDKSTWRLAAEWFLKNGNKF